MTVLQGLDTNSENKNQVQLLLLSTALITDRTRPYVSKDYPKYESGPWSTTSPAIGCELAYFVMIFGLPDALLNESNLFV